MRLDQPTERALQRKDRARFKAEMLLPYGVAVMPDGMEILFNRGYRPLYRRRPGSATTERAGPDDMEPKYRVQRHLYDSPHEDPHRNASVYRRCVAVLAEWHVPAPTDAMIPAAWELFRDAFAPS